jgi:hypothetical protein
MVERFTVAHTMERHGSRGACGSAPKRGVEPMMALCISGARWPSLVG